MQKTFYYQPTPQPKYLYYLFCGILVICVLVFFILLVQLFRPATNKSATIKDLAIMTSPIIAIFSYLMSNKGSDLTTPMFIFDEKRMIFNHRTKGFDIAWQDIEEINISMMFNIPTLIILTKSKKLKIDMRYFQSTENINVYAVFKDYVSQYSGKKLIF